MFVPYLFGELTMHVLITGGAGFIGSHLVKHHLSKGDNVHVIDDLSTGSMDNIKPYLDNNKFSFSEADIVTWDEMDEAVEWAERIYHLAAVVGVKRVLEDPVAVLSTNLQGTERLLQMIHEVGEDPEVLIASSSEVYGFNKNKVFSEHDDIVFISDEILRWDYAVSKLADEHLAYAYYYKYNMKVVTVRLFNTIGPKQAGRYGMVVPNFIKEAVENRPIVVFGTGKQTRSFCDVRDTVKVLDTLTGSTDACGKIINVGNDQEISIENLARSIKALAESSSKVQYKTYKEAYGRDFIDIDHRRPSLELLKKITGFQPEWKLEDTLKDLIKRFEKEAR